MASKGKSRQGKRKGKRQAPETPMIDMKRFAYDILVHSVTTFGVPQTCIYAWEGPENDYGSPGFLTAIFGPIIAHQMALRFTLHRKFVHWWGLHESGKLRDFFKDIINGQTGVKDTTDAGGHRIDPILNLEMSLAVLCEMVIFFYSKNIRLYVKELVGYWFSDYFRKKRTKFEKEGGLGTIYEKSNLDKAECMDAFYNAFIEKHCPTYEDSVYDEDLGAKFRTSDMGFRVKLAEVFPEVKSKPMTYISQCTVVVTPSTPPLTSRREEPSEIELPENSGLGFIPHEELLRMIYSPPASTAPSQNLPGPSSQETARNRRTSDPRSSVSSLEQGLGQVSLHSSRTKKTSEKKSKVPVVHGPAPEQASSGRSLQELGMQFERSPDLQESNSNLNSSVEQSLRQLSLESSAAEQLSEKKINVLLGDDSTSSQELLGACCQELTKEQEVKSKIKSRLCTSMEQGRLGYDSAEAKQSIEKKPNVSVAGDLMSSHNLPVATSRESAKEQSVKSRKKSKKKSKYLSNEEKE